MKKFFLITGAVLLIILIAVTAYIYFSGPALPPDTAEIIEQVLESELPEIVKGNTGYAKNGDVSIWYESIEPDIPMKGTILIIMGITNDAIAWPGYFIEPFVEAGYRVVRYDHRGTGMSDWMENWSEENTYTLDDMSGDGFAILDDLNVESAHIIGVSMGGMIAQTMSISNPERVLSLTSIMSSGFIEDPDLAPINQSFIFDLILLGLKYMIIGGEANIIKMALSARLLLRAGHETDIDVKDNAERVLYNLKARKGLNYNVSQQHLTAVSLSGSRYEELKELNVPALIIHGRADPLVPFEHGLKCAELIPGAENMWIENMGHDISPRISEMIIGRILDKYSSFR
jgi:pimeloyl-ACP methyl ester carboxylesterase